MLSTSYIFSQVFIIFSYILLIISFQSKSRKMILILGFASLIATGISYLLLSAHTGLAMVVVVIVRNIIFLFDKDRDERNKATKKDYLILMALYIISIVFAIYTYDGLGSLLSVVATMIYTFSIWQKDTRVYKILGIPTGIVWILYHIYISSIFGIILEFLLTLSAVIGIINEEKVRKKKAF